MSKKLFSNSSISEGNPSPHRTKTLKFHLFGKKILVLTICIFFSFILNAQVSKNINLTTAGTLSTALTAIELNSVTNLTITGTIDARDFKTMRDSMKVLAILDLSGANITSYSGVLGTWFTVESIDYPANAIPDCAFYFVGGKDNGKTSLKTVKIPESTSYIGKHSFRGCYGLTSFSLPSSVNQIGIYAFFSCINLAQIELPASVTSIADFAFYNCQGFSTFPLTSTITSIGEYAFYNCGYVNTLTIPSSVTSIGKNAFENCFGLTSISIPSSVTSIGDNAFEGCQSLTSAVIPSSMTSISNYVFYSCGKLKSVTIPSSVKSIGKYAFNYCGSLTSLTIPSSVTSIDNGAFNESGLISVSIPSSVTFLGDGAFCDCNSLTSVSIPSSITSISNNTFLRCKNLASITIPSSVTSIGIWAFEGCTKLTSVSIPSSVTSLGDCIFNGCSGLTSVTISSSATSLGYRAFGGCYRLTSISIPYSVKSIGPEAFYYCSGLKSIFSYSINPIDLTTSLSVFENVDKTTCILYVPAGSKSAYQVANQWKDFTNIVELNAGLFANAGPDQVINEGQVVTLDGTSSKSNNNNNPLSFKWTAPAGITLSSESASNPTFIAPEVSTETSFTFSLIINDGSFGSEADEVTIIVKQVNKAPMANAGTNQSVNENSLVTLDGSASADPDNDKLNYLWTAPAGITLSSETASNPSFIAPEVSMDTVFTFELTIYDGSVNSTADQVKVTVKQVNKAPIANAGTNQSVNENSLVTLDGSASSDPDRDELSYLWTAPAGITLSSETAKNPTFTSPEVNQDNIYRFILLVNDRKADSDTSQVSIIVKQVTPVLKLVSKTSDSQISSTEVTYQFYLKTVNSFYVESVTPMMNGDTAEFSLEPGEWIILASPAQNSSAFLPTYSGNTLEWINAEHIIVSEKGTTFKEITCFLPEIVNKGAGQISGYVYEKADPGTKSISLSNSFDTSGNPVSGALIRLFKKGNPVPVLSIFTDAQGFYKFDNLDIIDYQIVVEIPGFTQFEKFEIAISVDQPFTAVSFGVNTTSQVITDNNTLLISSLKIYPNPVVLFVNLEVGRNISSPYSILVYSIDGELMINQVSLTSKTILDFSEMLAGTYLIEVFSGAERQSSIVIKR
jgi:BspA type Leucine rich repeat region (6 copies)/Carboxypeptidase regulatory-like domain/REJ domain/Secretion system C-terminal sorting domain